MTEEKLNMKDYPALIALSLRNCFWGKNAIPDLSSVESPTVYYTVIATALLGVSAYNIMDGIFRLLTQFNIAGFLIRVLFWGTLLFICFDYKYAWYNLNYCKRSWWRDTKIHPFDICQGFFAKNNEEEIEYTDRMGMYGEYLASMAAEQLILKNRDITGYVFNGALIPTYNGGLFAESDLISVSEYGIHVIEVKNWRKKIMGDIESMEWQSEPVKGNDAGQGYSRKNNPFYQNLYHCNMLYDYLYRELPEGCLKQKNLNEVIKNVVLFSTPFFQDGVKKENRFYRSYGGYTQNYLYLNGYISEGFRGDQKVLTKEEAAVIAGLIWKLVLPVKEKKAKLEERKASGNAWKKPASYAVVEIQAPDRNGEFHEAMVIRRALDGHFAYYDLCDKRFRALPNCRLTENAKCYPVIVKDAGALENYENCPKEALELLESKAKDKNCWFNSLDCNVAYMENDIERTAKKMKKTSMKYMSMFLYSMENGMKVIGGYLETISVWAMTLLGVITVIAIVFLKGFSILPILIGLLWLVSPYGIIKLFFIGLEALADFNNYTYSILRKRL